MENDITKDLKWLKTYMALTNYISKVWKENLKWKEKEIEEKYKEILSNEIKSFNNYKDYENFIKRRPKQLITKLWLEKELDNIKEQVKDQVKEQKIEDVNKKQILEQIQNNNDKESFMRSLENNEKLKKYYHDIWWKEKEIQKQFSEKYPETNELIETKKKIIEAKEKIVDNVVEKKQIIEQKIDDKIKNIKENIKEKEIVKQVWKYKNKAVELYQVDKIQYDWTKNTIIWDLIIKTVIISVLFVLLLPKIAIIDTTIKKMSIKPITLQNNQK